MSKPDIEAFIEQANLHHPTIEFTAEVFDTETAFLDTVAYKGTRFKEKSILDAKTHFKVIPWFCIAHSLLRITLRHLIWRKRKLLARLATTKGAFAGAYPCTKQVEEKT